MKNTICICTGKTCSSRFSKYILKRLEKDKDFYKYPKSVEIQEHICMGNCQNWPNIKVNSEMFSSQNPVSASELIKKTIHHSHS